MEITWKKSDGFLVAGDRHIDCWSKVRNEINGLRPKPGKPDIYKSIPSNLPSMPRDFPVGRWKINKIIPHDASDFYLYPFFIATNAHQMLDRWDVDANGFYTKPSGDKIDDWAYGLHFSSSDWTQGCIRIKDIGDLYFLVALVKDELGKGRQPDFIVTE
jgi:hypothetical protein